MGMGHAANYADCVELEFLLDTCPQEYQNLEMVMDEYDYSWDQIGQEAHHEQFEVDEIKEAYEELQQAFYVATGLKVYAHYHNHEDEGDRYDEVNGLYFHVEGVYQLSPAGERNKDKIERKFFVTFG